MNTEEFLSFFQSQTPVEPVQIIAQSVLLLVLSKIVSLLYVHTGNSLSQRSRLAAIFPLMALTTMLIISIVKSSLALSLGLVGALSIVRFRAAIKDPEELAYIFLAISLGLGFGADQILLTSVFFGVIVSTLIMRAVTKGRFNKLFTDVDSVHLQVQFAAKHDLAEISKVLARYCSETKLTRLDQKSEQVMRFIVKPKSVASIDKIRKELLKIDSKAELSFLQYQPLV